MAKGEFSPDPTLTWLTEDGTADRKMILQDAFWFRDPGDKTWNAPAASTVDGASIPRALWTTIGSPFTGDYRRASIVHDVACDDAGGDKKKRRAADRMFFQACRAGGCSVWQSTILYVGVRIGAAIPNVASWHASVSHDPAGPRIRKTEAESLLERDFEAVTNHVLAGGETEDVLELERRTDTALFAVTGFREVARRPRRSARK